MVALQDLAALWEASLDPQAERPTTVWRTTTAWPRRLRNPATWACAVRRWCSRARTSGSIQRGQLVLGWHGPESAGGDTLEVSHVAVRRRVASLALDGPPDLARLAIGSSE